MSDWISRVVAIYHEGFTVAQISEMFPEWGEPWMIAEIVEDFA